MDTQKLILEDHFLQSTIRVISSQVLDAGWTVERFCLQKILFIYFTRMFVSSKDEIIFEEQFCYVSSTKTSYVSVDDIVLWFCMEISTKNLFFIFLFFFLYYIIWLRLGLRPSHTLRRNISIPVTHEMTPTSFVKINNSPINAFHSSVQRTGTLL